MAIFPSRNSKEPIENIAHVTVDALSAGSGQRSSSRDSIGCGPRTVAGVFEKHDIESRIHRVEDVLAKRGFLRKFDHIAISAMTMDWMATQKMV
ncbi:MAG: hypothetical protein ACXAAQ_15050, partial [Candidatus Thorarchaeota archaeon]